MASQPHSSGQDPVQVDARHYSVELENDRVRVLRIRYGPNERSQMHTHPASLAILITDARIRFAYPDGRSEDISGKAGEVLSLPPTEHVPENLGSQPFEAILVEMKS